VFNQRRKDAGSGDQQEHGLGGLPTLHIEQPVDGPWVAGIGAEAVDGLGGKRDKPASADAASGASDRGSVGTKDERERHEGNGLGKAHT
jgi:hypothetical protein